MPLSRALSALLLVLGLAACAGPTTRPAYIYDTYDLGVLNGPAGQGGMAAYVVGEPFPGQQAAVRRAVEHALTHERFGPRFPVTAEPSPELARSAYKAVVVFDPPVRWDGYAVCKHDELPESRGRSGAGVEVLAIFCEGHREMTSVRGGIAAADSPDDPRFRALLKQVSLSLFPPIRPLGDRDEGARMSKR